MSFEEKKLKPDGTVDMYNAPFITEGFRQRENISFFYAFYLVTRITFIRVLISIGAIYNLIVHQMNIKITF